MQKDGTLSVPDVPVVPYITGDGVGAEVTPSMQAVVNAAVQKAYGGKRRIYMQESSGRQVLPKPKSSINS